MACKNCAKDPWSILTELEFDQIVFDKQVKPGDFWHIYVKVRNNSIIIGDYGRVCIYDGDKVLKSSGSFKIPANGIYAVEFTGVMPSRDLYLTASLVEERHMFVTNCSDTMDILIKEADVSIPVDPLPIPDPTPTPTPTPIPIPIPWPTPDPEDDDFWDWLKNIFPDFSDLSTSIVWALVLLLVIIVLMRFK